MTRRWKIVSFNLLWAVIAVCFSLCGPTKTASAANPATINFQGKVVSNATGLVGTNVADGSYSFVFRLYDSSSPTTTTACNANASCWWEETDTLTVTNGVFQVELGATCAFSAACNSTHSGINWNTNNALYLTFKFNNDAAGFMSPTVHLTSVPYAFNADNLGGISSSGYVQLTPASQQSGSIDVNGAINSANGLNTGSTQRIDNSGNLVNIGNLTATAGSTFTAGGANGFSFKSGTDNTNAFQVQSAAGADLLVVDTNAVMQLIQNNSMEANINGWTAKGGGTITQTDASAKFGSRALQIVTGGAAGNGAAYSVPFKATTQYSLSVWARKDAGSAAAFNISFQENGADNDAKCLTNQTLTATWTEYTCTFTTGATVNNTGNVYIKQTDTTTDTIYVDGLSLVQAATPVTFDPGGSNVSISTAQSNIVLNGTNTGELQPWRQSANSVTNVREDAATITANGYIYVIGGYDGATVQNTVYYAKINADGSTGSWNTTNVLPGARRYLTASVVNGYLYAIGGFDGTTAQATVFYAKLNGDGTIGTWQTGAQPLPGARVGAAAVISNGFIYVLGGCSDNTATCGTPTNTVYYAKAFADGATGAWTPNTNTLTLARGFGTASIANGYIYYIGGYNATAQTTVYYAPINSDASVASFNSSTVLPNARRELTSIVADGYLYAIGGFDGTNRVSTVYYTKLYAGGTTGAWTAEANALPANRSAQTTTVANGYIYAIGGFDGTNRAATVYYASTPRLTVGGSLDLIGLGTQTLSDFGGGGALTAGNTRVVGDLRVDGYADFNNGISVDSALTLNAVSATAGQTVFNINNNLSNSIFNIKHMGTNFGAAATTGAFISKNSYWGEEFNVTQTNNCSSTTTTNAWKVRGDSGNNVGTACTAGNGELALSRVLGLGGSGNTSAACSSNSATACGGSVPSATYGLERISATSTATALNTAATLEYVATTAAGGTASAVTAANNLPIFTAKVKPSLVNSGSNARFFVGLGDKGAANGLFPTNGIFFSNCTATATPACTSTTWIGVVTTTAAGVVGTVTCSAGTETGTINTANFNYLRIEVRSNTDIHFFVDTNTATGINETECGSGVTGTGPAAVGLSPMLETAFMTNSATTENLDIDFVRMWQDDPADADLATDGVTTNSQDGTTANDPALSSLSTTDSGDALTPPTDTSGAVATDGAPAASPASTTTASDPPLADAAGTPTPNDSVTTNSDGSSQLKDANGHQLITFDPAGNATFSGDLNLADANLSGNLTVGGDANIAGLSTFQKLATFLAKTVFRQDVEFDGHIAVSKDSAGYAMLHDGESTVHVKFATPYADAPIITANRFDGQFSLMSVNNVKADGFDLTLQTPSIGDTKLSWTAIGTIDPQTATNPPPNSASLVQ